MSVKKYCKIQKEIADIGINKYYEAFIDKKFEDRAKSYAQYVKDCQEIYKKYKTTGTLLEAWQTVHEKEIGPYLKAHSELDYKTIYADKYEKFVLNVYNFLEEKVNKDQKAKK